MVIPRKSQSVQDKKLSFKLVRLGYFVVVTYGMSKVFILKTKSIYPKSSCKMQRVNFSNSSCCFFGESCFTFDCRNVWVQNVKFFPATYEYGSLSSTKYELSGKVENLHACQCPLHCPVNSAYE